MFRLKPDVGQRKTKEEADFVPKVVVGRLNLTPAPRAPISEATNLTPSRSQLGKAMRIRHG